MSATTRAGILARVSSDDTGKDGRNLGGQIADGEQHAQRKGYRVTHYFVENETGVSGADREAPETKRAVELAKAGEYDVLIVREVDRLARNLLKQLLIEDQLKEAGVKVEYTLQEFPDTPTGRLSKNVTASIAEFEREQIRLRTLRGKQKALEHGQIFTNHRPPYGYRATIIDGKRTFEIVPIEAQTIKDIFYWYTVERLSMYAIANKLSTEKRPTYTDLHPLPGIQKRRNYGQWATSIVGKILKNSTYAGQWQGHANGVIVSVEVPAIVSVATFEAAQQRRAQNAHFSKRNTKYKYLMQKRLKCVCGYAMRARSGRNFYYVPNHTSKVYQHVECSHRRGFTVADLDNTVWRWLEEITDNPEYIGALFERYQHRQNKSMVVLGQRLKVKQSELAEAEAELANVTLEIPRRKDGSKSKQILTQRQDDLDDRVATLEREIADLQGKMAVDRITDDDAAAMMRFIGKLNNVIARAKTFTEKQYAVEILDVHGVAYYKDGRPFIDLSSKIAYQDAVPIVSTLCSPRRYNVSDNLIIFPMFTLADATL